MRRKGEVYWIKKNGGGAELVRVVDGFRSLSTKVRSKDEKGRGKRSTLYSDGSG